MIRRHLNRTHFCLRLTTFLLPALAFAIAAYLRFDANLFSQATNGVDSSPYFALLLLVTVVWAMVAEHYGLCTVKYLFAPGGKTPKSLLACFVMYAAVLAMMFFYRAESFSRLFIALSAVTLVLLTIFTRVVFRVIWHRQRRCELNWIKILIIGADEFARQVARSLTCGEVMPCRTVGFVSLPGQKAAEFKAPVYTMEDLETLASRNGIDEVILALPLSRFAEIPALMTRLEPLCVPIRATLDMGEDIFVRERLFDLGGMLMLDLNSTPAESITYFILKRAFDLVFSFAAVVVVGPLMLLIAALVKLTSPGPVLFTQDRVGLNGRIFRIYKFRTMRQSAADESNTRWTTHNDPRRTRLGSFLRATSLDELPQFFNVIGGDMSVVGPRPERPFFVQKFLRDIALYNSRHYLKVGITGWAQVNGWRGDTSIFKRLEYDLYYLRNWSLSFDLQIILLTLLRGLSNRNAY
ncbi:MAG TPA: undecaprenyl-phosphate glucose phosphotransferase [Terriglobia bacterium]|nr:undecaprenyl-phosphate glucose phosphotransferase [Terriglobia bacterium]